MIRINLRFLGLYAFSVAVMYLAGVYFGTFLFSLFLMFLVLPLVSLAAFLIWVSGVSCVQELSLSTPVKGDEVDYTLRVRNRSFLPVPKVHVHFLDISESLRTHLNDFTAYLPVRRDHEVTYRITCPYRGRYAIGVSSVEFTDQLGIITFRKRVTPVAVTVFPRILAISRFAPIARDVEGSGRYASAGILPDTTLFQQLKEYRDGDSIKHIYWKKYASTGKPYLKEYDRTKRAGVRIYFDARPTQRFDVHRLEQEDASVEALVAIVRYLLSHRVHTTVVAATRRIFSFVGEDMGAFERFYRGTAEIDFTRGVSPLNLFRTDRMSGALESQTCVFITHIVDPRLLQGTEGSTAYDTIFVVNRAGQSGNQLDRFDSFAAGAKRQGRHVVTLQDSQSILEDLTGHRLAYAQGGGGGVV